MTFAHAGQWGPDSITNRGGVPLPNLAITVNVHGGGLATLYTDRTKATGAPNPTSTDIEGNLVFFADPGLYDLVGNGATITVEVGLDSGDIGGPFVIAADTTDGYASTVTFDLSQAPTHFLTLAGTPALALLHDDIYPRFTVVLNSGTGGFSVTWWSGIRWALGAPPSITTTPNKYDTFTFIRAAPGVYLGLVVAQGL